MNGLHPDVSLRPRSGAEAIDLGLRMTQRDLPLLLAGQAVLILPTLLLLSLLLQESALHVWVLLWWLKPLFERMSLLIFSRRLFGESLTLRQALRLWRDNALHGLAADLLWRRFSLSRSYYLPLLLEGLDGAGRRKRRHELGSSTAARWLTTFGAHLELLLGISVPLMILFFLPSVWPASSEQWFDLLISLDQMPWLEPASNLLYACTLICWGPFYVGAGFSLYMNRRCEREAWDLELVFRSLASRLATPLLILLLLLPGAQPPQAAEAAAQSEAVCLLPREDASPEARRLTSQALDSQQASRQIRALLDAPPFRNQEERLRWGDERKTEADTAPPSIPLWVMQALEVLLWGLLLAAVILLGWRYRAWLLLFASRLRRQPVAAEDDTDHLFSLPAVPQLGADELEQAVRSRWPSDPRAALALLYAALLGELERRLGAPLPPGLTEGDVLQLIDQRVAALGLFAGPLLRAWQASAYGHRQPPDSLLEPLLEHWRNLQADPHGRQS